MLFAAAYEKNDGDNLLFKQFENTRGKSLNITIIPNETFGYHYIKKTTKKMYLRYPKVLIVNIMIKIFKGIVKLVADDIFEIP